MRTTSQAVDHRIGCQICRQAVDGVTCHAGHQHANDFSASRCTSRPAHSFADSSDAWPTTSWPTADSQIGGE